MPYDYTVERALRQQKLRRKARRGEIALRRLYKFIRFLIILFIFYSVFRTLNCHYWYLSSDIYTKKGTPRIGKQYCFKRQNHKSNEKNSNGK